MKKKEIIEAAKAFSEREYEVGDIDWDALYKGFYHGAQWRVKSVWHNSKDLPESNSDGRVKYSILVCFDLHEVSPMVVSENDMDLYAWKRDWYGEKIHWAYVKDLMP